MKTEACIPAHVAAQLPLDGSQMFSLSDLDASHYEKLAVLRMYAPNPLSDCILDHQTHETLLVCWPSLEVQWLKGMRAAGKWPPLWSKARGERLEKERKGREVTRVD